MSATKEEIVHNVLRAMRRVGSLTVQAEVEKWLNREYFDICKKHSWHALRKKISIDMTDLADDDDSGLWLPSNLFGIDRVRDQDNDIEFVRRDEADIVEPDEEGFRYYTHVPNREPEFFDALATIEEGSNTITCAALTTDYTDEWARFGSQPGYYQLDSQTTFTPTYNGPTLERVDLRIRPENTQKIVVMDRAENILRDRTVDVYYWEAPQPLYRDSDACVLPISAPLELAMLIRCLGVIGKRELSTDRYRGEMTRAWDEAVRLNPDYPRKMRPRDEHNRIFDLTNSYFGERRASTNDSLRYIFRRET